jgi:hypothetical protein
MSETEKPTGLALLRVPFAPNQISKLPKPTKAQTDAVKADFKAGIRCTLCGAWHHPQVVHLDYVGHAALTDRLLDADPAWSWEPVAMGQDGQPMLDSNGGMWIRLTVCGVTRLGYGDAGEKTGANAVKERIGDALRNAAMRFGAALDLWHKGDLHAEAEEEQDPGKKLAQKVAAANVKPTADAKKNLSPEQVTRIDKVVSSVQDWLTQGSIGDAVAVADEAEMDADEHVYFWGFFSSKERTAMTAEAKARRERAKARESQPA